MQDSIAYDDIKAFKKRGTEVETIAEETSVNASKNMNKMFEHSNETPNLANSNDSGIHYRADESLSLANRPLGKEDGGNHYYQ